MQKMVIILLSISVFILTACNDLIGTVEEFGCGFTSGKTQAHCYKDSANRQNDPDPCSKIQSLDDVGNAPKNQCFQDLAVANKDSSYCEKIINPGFVSTTKEACKAALLRMGVTAEAPTQSQCRFDSDCAPICEGNVYWKRGCDAQSNACKNTFDTLCTLETIGDFQFQAICDTEGCHRNTKAIEGRIDELVIKGKQYTKDMERITQYQLIATKRCLSALEDVTNKLIVDAATAMASPLPSLAEIGASRTLDAIEKLTETQMSAEEFIALHCSLQKSLGTDFKLVEKKRDIILEQIRELRAST